MVDVAEVLIRASREDGSVEVSLLWRIIAVILSDRGEYIIDMEDLNILDDYNIHWRTFIEPMNGIHIYLESKDEIPRE